MGKKLAIKGHSTRSKEIIELLEMMGGENKFEDISFIAPYIFLYIDDGYFTEICWDYIGDDNKYEEFVMYTLDEFEEKYPFKVGDKVTLDNKLCSITWMCWECNNVYYQVQGIGEVFTKKVTADEINPYKEINNMRKKLTIKGHETRGEEIIKLLEMLGGHNSSNLFGYRSELVYFITDSGDIDCRDINCILSYFTLEEFLEKYPYKVGDQVIAYAEGVLASFSIKGMRWNNKLNKVEYKICSSWYDVSMISAIQPYTDYDIKTNKEEDKDTIEPTTEINLNHPCFDGHNKIELIIPENWKFEQRDNKMFGIRKYPQHPTTYGECCDILGYDPCEDEINCYKGGLIESFVRLLICYDAYCKIAGEQMGLGKPWEPDYKNPDIDLYVIINIHHNIEKAKYGYGFQSCVISFPTAEMRDAFYDNFKKEIEQCKGLL